MKCPFCSNGETQVVETRVAEDGDFVRRRRQCLACEKRFTTYERPDVSFPSVVKKDGRRIYYERAKLLGSMNLALRKRPVSTEQIVLPASIAASRTSTSSRRSLTRCGARGRVGQPQLVMAAR